MNQKNPAQPKGAASGDLGYVSYMADILHEENKPLKISTLISLVFYTLLLWVVFPESEAVIEEGAKKQQKAVVIKRFTPPPPPKQEPPKAKTAIKTKAATVPIPDPTPDEPEPYREYAVVEEFTAPSTDLDFEIELPDNPPGPLRVGGDVKAPTKVKQVPPVYPELARKARIQGVVIVEAVIDREGNVVRAKVLRSPGAHFGFDQAAIDAVKQWKFKPGTQNGKPVDVIFTLTVIFKLE
jgi:TonB family protein